MERSAGILAPSSFTIRCAGSAQRLMNFHACCFFVLCADNVITWFTEGYVRNLPRGDRRNFHPDPAALTRVPRCRPSPSW